MLKVNDQKCTGCYACQNICPKDCITLQENDEGFYYPNIDADKCIQCTLCEKVCPIEKGICNRNRSTVPIAYAAYSKDDDVRAQSMTAGISYLCGKHIIEQGGVVFGVVGDVINKVYHTKATTLSELSHMQGSKYLQSEVGNIYREVRTELNMEKKVLFTGTPCQIAGLYAYLGKEYDNLFTLDIICHGVPSRMVLKKYISEIEAEKGSKVVAFYRDKEKGWKPCWFTYILENGEKISLKGRNNPYNNAFITNMITRKSCQHCDYAQIPRVADITVGDYLQGDKSKIHDIENKGLSLVTINSEKGSILFASIRKEISAKEYPLAEVQKESEHLARSPKMNIYRRTFFYMIKKKSFFTVIKILTPRNIIHKNLRRIYGIVCYIYEFFKRDSLIG